MQDALELNNFRAIFQRIGLKPQQRLDLSYLQLSDDTITTNPVEIYEAHKDHFDTHHSFPDNLDASAQALQEDPEMWRKLVSPTTPPLSTAHLDPARPSRNPSATRV